MLLGGGAEPEATGHVDRHGRLALTVRSARSKIDTLAACCKFRSFEYRESCTDGFNTRMFIELLTWSWTYLIIIMEAFIKRRIPGKTTCSKALQYNSNKVVIKLKLY